MKRSILKFKILNIESIYAGFHVTLVLKIN